MNSFGNKSVTVLLSIGILGCVVAMPWGRWLHSAVEPEAALSERVAEYVRLRKADDWMAIYSMTDASDRQACPLAQYLSLYGMGTLKVVSLEEKKRKIDAATGEATVDMVLEGELQLDRLPPKVRRSLGPQDPSALRKSGPFATEWRWREGNWWLRMDREATTGLSADGKQVRPAGN
ncbi:MAG: hypothetical protein JNK78_02620 [Planctomycetes bacterium]|nr:hypothetical protein [Planctomycetota bacterium]